MIRLLVAMVAVGGCAPSPPHATAADAARANVALAELEQGRTIVVGKCGACHRPPLPDDPWQRWLPDMAARARLDASERHLAEQYLSVMAVTK